MKHFLVCIALTFIVCSAFAQQANRNYLYNSGYKVNVQTSTLFTFANSVTITSLTSSHGFAFGNGLYVGGGLGVTYSPQDNMNIKNQMILDVFAEVKYSFLKNSIVSPFVNLMAGGACNYSSYGTGYFVKPSVGIDIWRFSISAGMGRYAINYASIDGKIDDAPAIIGGTELNNGIFVGLAYNFR